MNVLGLPQPRDDSDNIYIMVPDSANVIKKGKNVVINKKKFHVYPTWGVVGSVVFLPYFEKSSSESYSMVVTIDLNSSMSERMS
jgi:hypothetical protein